MQCGSQEAHTFRTSTGVPEPAIWATMLIGFVMVGGVVRVRRVVDTRRADDAR